MAAAAALPLALQLEAKPWRLDHDRTVLIRFRLTPKGGKDAVDGVIETADGIAFKARVRAVPEDGAANAGLVSLVARWLDVPKSNIALVSGHKSRVKTIGVRADAVRIDARLSHFMLDFTT